MSLLESIKQIEKKQCAALGEELPRLGFGIMRLENNEDGTVNYENSKKMVDLAFASGVNYFDTAMPYLDGQSEAFIGKAFAEYDRSSYFLADKLPIYYIKEDGDAERYFAQQLANCGVEYFDFYLVHSLSDPKRVDPFEQFKLYEFMKQKKAEGKIRHMGFSFHGNAKTLRYLLDTYPAFEFVQLQINYYDWVDINAKELYDIVEEYGLPCFVMEPVKGGFLSSFSPRVEQSMRAHRPDDSLSSWALRWVASKPNIALVLSGMTLMEHVQDNLRTFSNLKPIDAQEQVILDEVVSSLQKINAVPCTRCSYCMPCPAHVKIPTIFSIYNNYKKTENLAFLKMQYNNKNIMLSHERAHACIGCRKCMQECPQKIEIPTRMKEIDAAFQALGVVL